MIANFTDWVEEYKREIGKPERLGYLPEIDMEVLRNWYDDGLSPAQAADEEMSYGL